MRTGLGGGAAGRCATGHGVASKTGAGGASGAVSVSETLSSMLNEVIIPRLDLARPWEDAIDAPFTISAPISGLNERRVYRMKAALAVAVVLLSACADTPPPFTADVNVSASQTDTVGGRAQLVVNVTNTGPTIPHIGLTFVSADKWYERHTLTDPGGCTVATDYSALDCGDLAAGASATFSITGTASQAGTFHYELELRELVRPFHYVNDHPNGADVQAWDETIAAA